VKLSFKTGSEGPAHDPYGYDEMTVTLNNGVVVLYHRGLGSWLEVTFPDCKPIRHDGHDSAIYHRFVSIVGYEPRDLEKFEARRLSRCRQCGCRRTTSESGYPGESFEVCIKCGNVVSSDFNEAAIR